MATIENRGNGSWRVTVSGGYGPDDIETVVLSREDVTRYFMRRVSDEIMFICEEEFKKHMMVAAENERQRNERMIEEEDPDDQQEDE